MGIELPLRAYLIEKIKPNKDDGYALCAAVSAYKPLVNAAIDAYLQPEPLALLHSIKGKSEYAKNSRRCDDDLNYTQSVGAARVIAESYFWEKLHTGRSLQWNLDHLVKKRQRLLSPQLTRHHAEVDAVYSQISNPERVAQDLKLKNFVNHLDYALEYIGERYSALPPGTVGLRGQLDIMYACQRDYGYGAQDQRNQAAFALMASVL